MEKLVKLLNEYHFSGTEYVGYFLDEDENRIYFRTKVVDKGLVDEQRISDERIISKKFGFIKWLVDNDKIDHKIYEDMKFTAIKQGVLIDKKSGSTAQETREIIKNGYIDTFIALLAIQDEPIEFLISILK